MNLIVHEKVTSFKNINLNFKKNVTLNFKNINLRSILMVDIYDDNCLQMH